MDCVAGMREYPDKFFDLAICDPPYGIGAENGTGKYGVKKFKNSGKNWDSETPLLEYFTELFRVSKNQIIFGGNYFISKLYESRCWVVWDKGEGFYNRKFAECELAWTSFNRNTLKIKYDPLAKGDYLQKIHPTQKPIAVYEFCIKTFAVEGDKILDTHLGSGSSRIAAQKLGFDFYGFEIDADYFEQSEKRFKDAVSMPLFDKPVYVPQQLVLV
jgi:site-specific DNA-methyltransferase (adenine-specific)